MHGHRNGAPAAARSAAGLLLSDRSGSIAVMAAVSMLALIAAIAMALDLANIYLAKSVGQRVADQAARAAGFAYAQSSNNAATAAAAASSMAKANGSGSGSVQTSMVASPSGSGNTAAKVVYTATVALSPFGQAISSAGIVSASVAATSYAEILPATAATPCVIALGSGGISASGGVSVTATGCAVGSSGSIALGSGPTVTALAAYATGTITGSVQSSPTAGKLYPGSPAQTDPYASAGIFAHLPAVAALASPAAPSMGSAPSGAGSTLTCTGTLTVPATTYAGITLGSGCTTINFTGGAGTETDVGGYGLYLSSGSVTLNFNAGTYKISGGIFVSGSSTTAVINATGSPVIDLFWTGGYSTDGGISLSGGSSQLTVNGPATYNMQGSVTSTGYGAATFVKFNNSRGSGTSTFNVANGFAFSIGNAVFPNGNYTTSPTVASGSAGIAVTGGGTTATFGNGNYNLGGGISVGSGAALTVASPSSSANVSFQVPTIPSAGSAIGTSGTFTLGGFTAADLNGPLTLYAGAAFGESGYPMTLTINGALSACGSGGGAVTGTDVSIVASGAICFAQGFTPVSISAPTALTSATEGTAATVAMASSATAESEITAGATDTQVTGAVYLPNAALGIDGAGRLSGGGGCVQVIAKSLALSAGGSVQTDCTSLGSASASAGSVALAK